MKQTTLVQCKGGRDLQCFLYHAKGGHCAHFVPHLKHMYSHHFDTCYIFNPPVKQCFCEVIQKDNNNER
jgi:hypothetical protein